MTTEPSIDIETMIEELIEEMEREECPLTAWELDFVESVSARFFEYGNLSSKQEETLTDIYEKVMKE